MAPVTSLMLAVVLLASAWHVAVPVFGDVSPLAFQGLLIASAALCAFAFRRTTVTVPRIAAIVVAGAAAVAAVLLPYPYSAGPALLGIGLVIAIATPAPLASSLGWGVSFAGVVASLQTLALVPYWVLAPRFHDTLPIGRVTYLVLRLAGADVRLSPEGLLLHNGARTIVFGLAPEHLGVLFLLLFVVGAIPVLLVARPRVREVAVAVVVVALYAELRVAVLALMQATSAHIDLFWVAAVTAASFLPLALVLAATARLRMPAAIAFAGLGEIRRRHWLAAGAALLGSVVLVGAFGFHDPGTAKAGRVIMDEGHSDWEWSTEVYDTEWYGEKSGYNYYNLFQYLGLHYDIAHNTEPITDDVLADCDVLILKTPTSPYAAEERETIVRFVRSGGGLWLVGDHTNVFGTSTNLNPLAEEFGLRFTPTATYQLDSGNLQEFEPPRVLPHPIVQHLPQTFLFATSSTIESDVRASSAITGHALKSLVADYSQDNFFPEVSTDPEMRFGLFTQGATATSGKGRVAAFADSTVFSNFWMFMPGKPELALSYVDWLNRENSLEWMRWVLAAFGAGGLLAAAWLARREGAPAVAWAVAAGMLAGVPVGVLGWGAYVERAYTLPQPRADYVNVAFEQQFSDLALPADLDGFNASPERSYATFYVWNQRLGYVPSADRTLDGALEHAEVLVLVRPVETPAGVVVDRLEEWVRAGGRLLVMDDAGTDNAAADAFLAPYGLAVGDEPLPQAMRSRDSTAAAVPFTRDVTDVQGGTTLLATDEGATVGAYVQVGDGLVTVFGDAGLFSSAYMGQTNQTLNLQQRSISDLEYALMRFVAEDTPFEF